MSTVRGGVIELFTRAFTKIIFPVAPAIESSLLYNKDIFVLQETSKHQYECMNDEHKKMS